MNFQRCCVILVLDVKRRYRHETNELVNDVNSDPGLHGEAEGVLRTRAQGPLVPNFSKLTRMQSPTRDEWKLYPHCVDDLHA